MTPDAQADALIEAEAHYTRFPTYQCRPAVPHNPSCGALVPGFPGMDALPCPECTQRTREGQMVVRGRLVKLTFEQANALAP